MRNLFTAFLFIINLFVFGQAPQFINYQGIARDAAGVPVTNTIIGLQFIISTATNPNFHAETQLSVPVNSLGLFNTKIGLSPQLPATGWESTPVTLNVSISINGGPFVALGSQNLASVPFALYAGSAPVPTLQISGNSLSLAGGNTVTLPGGTTYTNGSGIAIAGSVISNSSPDQTVNIANGTNVNVSGTYPNFTVDATPTLSLQGAQLSISGGNSITLPTGTTYTNGAGISLVSGTIITNTAPNQTVNINGPGVLGSYPNYTVMSAPPVTITPGNTNITITGSAPNYTVASTHTLSLAGNNLSISNGNAVTLPAAVTPTVIGSGIAAVTPTTGNNFTINVPASTYNNNTGIFTTGANTISIAPSLSLTGTTLSSGPGSNSVSLSSLTSPWTFSVGNVFPNNFLTDKVGIGTNSPNAKLDIVGNSTLTTLSVFNSNASASTPILLNSLSSLYTTRAVNDGNGVALDVFKSFGAASGRAAQFTISNPSNSSDVAAFSTSGNGNVIYSSSSGTGASGNFVKTGTGFGLISNHSGTSGSAAFFNLSNASNSGQALNVQTSGNGDAIGTYNVGSGRALYASNSSSAQTILSSNTGSGYALHAANTGTIGGANRAGFFQGGLDINGKTSGPGNFALYVNNSSFTNLFNVRDDGKVGIGTTAPSVPLEILNTSGQVGLQVNGTDPSWSSLYVNATNVSSQPGFGYLQAGILKGGHWINASGNWFLDVNGATRMTVMNNGRVGIGTTVPTTSLHVAGNVRIVDGTQAAGRVLTSDASGNASWQGPPPKIAFNAGSNAVANQNVPGATLTTVIFGAGNNYFNDGGAYNLATNEFIPPAQGIYFLSTYLSISGSAGSNLQVWISGPGPWFARTIENIPNTGNTIVHISATVNSAITPGPWKVQVYSNNPLVIQPYDSGFSGFKVN